MPERNRDGVNRRSFLRTAATLGSIPVLWSTTVAADDGPDLTPEEARKAEKIVERISQSDDPKRALARLPKDEQKLVAEFLKPASYEVAALEKPGSQDSCKEVEVWYTAQNTVDGDLWSYHQEVTWCYDGSIVTSTNRQRWGETHTVGWSFDGNIGSNEQGGVGSTFYESWTQGEFSLCLGGNIGCVQYSYPWVEATVYNDGSYDSDGDG